MGTEYDSKTRQRLEELRGQLKKARILLATNCEGTLEYRKPSEVYIISPELEVYFESEPRRMVSVRRCMSLGNLNLKTLGVERDIRDIATQSQSKRICEDLESISRQQLEST